MTRTTLLFTGLLLATIASAQRAATVAQDAASPLPLRAVFETKTTTGVSGQAQRERWTLVRAGSHLEYIYERAGVRMIDAWSQTHAELALTRIFPEERTLVEYSEGQLRALGRARSWRQLGGLLPDHPEQLGLQKRGEVNVNGRTAVRYEGSVQGAQIAVSWIEPAQLPASLRISRGQFTRTTVLQSLQLGQAQQFEAADLDHYRHIDAADLGDLEQDAFVVRHEAQLHAP